MNYISLGDLKEKECSPNSPQDILKNSVKVKRIKKAVTWEDEVVKQNEMKRDFIECTLGDFDEKECSSNSLDTHLTFSETRMEEKDELEHKKSMEIFEQYYSDFSSLFEE